MNARTPLHNQLNQTALPAPVPVEDDDEINLVEYWDILVDNRWIVSAITVLAIVIGGAYAFLARPVYEANLLIQVEDSSGSAKSFLGEAASLFDVKTPAAAEMEIIRSRMVIGQAVDSTLLYIDAGPHYLPLVGNWLARRATAVSEPGFLGIGGYVTGAETISVTAFDVPQGLEGSPFRVTAHGNGQYGLSHPNLPSDLLGSVGAPLVRTTPLGTVSLLVSSMQGKPGAEFNLTRRSRLTAIRGLQSSLKLAEQGRQSGVIDATLQGAEPEKLALVLNEIGRQYVRQNVERKAAEAQKMLAFLDVQLPQFKKQLDQSEEAYNQYRNKQGTVALDEEAKLILSRSVDLQGKLLEAQQKRRELVSRFMTEHPVVKTLDAQIAAWNREIGSLNARVRAMPSVQQDALRLERDAKVNNEAYQSLRNNALQLQLIREGKVGNVRLIDEATVPEQAVKPKRSLVLALAAMLGLLSGVVVALARNALFRGIRNPQEIEAHTGLGVYSTIPLSAEQEALTKLALARQPGQHLLALLSPSDPAVESLRSLRTALQFAMLEAPNNRVLITGATPGVGKSFVSANFAALLASAGKRVLLIDADLRKGHLNHFFGTQRERGLSEVVAGSLQASAVIRRGLVPNLDVLTTGVLPPNPAELMMSAAFANVLDELSPQYDLVIVDTPPVLVAADTLGMAAQVGTVLLVARAGQTQIGELHESAKRLAHAGKTVSGVLFNAMDMSRRHYGSYGYKYGGYRYRQYSYQGPR
ncbi:polysaccharide biosynthesis tyrosine autokinase [Ramlibacter sp. RBP-2]|uniref:Putative tyrosine-protein kinase EpsB n=1 Tax=Ramlibacter lithotrophicus TaxID=2606681 RepID=A0A7X6DK88_9BURK|nr:polysaccharide biosynthesis tyrosine autokinase [Ramlibacter lithotrophicus]NKE68705.1 polysaccharide biosynthesis tyrosine autokinase [Ramlibacter lithotrophicus]